MVRHVEGHMLTAPKCPGALNSLNLVGKKRATKITLYIVTKMQICQLILAYSTVRQCVSEAVSLTKVMPVTPGRRCAEQRGAVSDVLECWQFLERKHLKGKHVTFGRYS